MELTSLVARSLANSLTPAAIETVSPGFITLKNSIAVVLGDEAVSGVLSRLSGVKKLVWFGKLPTDTRFFGLRRAPSLPQVDDADVCPSCTLAEHHTESAGRVL